MTDEQRQDLKTLTDTWQALNGYVSESLARKKCAETALTAMQQILEKVTADSEQR